MHQTPQLVLCLVTVVNNEPQMVIIMAEDKEVEDSKLIVHLMVTIIGHQYLKMVQATEIQTLILLMMEH